MNLDAYIRVSDTRGREDDLISPELQAGKMDEYGQAPGHTLTMHPPELDVSGGKMQREVLDQILDRIRKHESDGIIVSKLNRFARTLLGGLQVIQEIEAAGGTLISVADNIDLSTPTGKLVTRILLSVAEMELERIREEWSDAQRSAVTKGVCTASAVPPGYTKTPKTDKDHPRMLVPNADALAIKRAFQMRGTGSSISEIAAMLNAQAPYKAPTRKPKPTAKGKKPKEPKRPTTVGQWPLTTVGRLFTNRVYRGELIRGTVTNPTAHKPIVTEQEWQAANSIPKRTSPRAGSDPTAPSLLTGLIRCAGCGYAMTPVHSVTPRAGGATARVAVYKCKGKHSTGRCPASSSIKRDRADAYVLEAWREQMAKLERGGAVRTPEVEAVVEEIANLKDELAQFAADITLRDALGPDGFREQVDTRVANIADAEKRLRILSGQASVVAPTVAKWDDMDLPSRRKVLAGSVDVVYCRRGEAAGRAHASADDRLRILWRGDGENVSVPYTW